MVERDILLRALQDVLSDVAEDIHKNKNLRAECQNCPVYTGLSTFAVKLRKAGIYEESEIVRQVRERYDI